MMKLRSMLLGLLALGLMLVLHPIQAQDTPTLINPGFEDPYIDIGGNPPQQVANGWNTWFVPAPDGSPNFEGTEPEYYEAVDADRIRSGSNAQRYESFFATHTGGLFQVVDGVSPNAEVTFSVFAYVWSSSLDDEDVSEEDGDVIFQVGIDPTGGTDGTSDEILWSVGVEQYDAYNPYTVSALAEGTRISVWIRSRVGFPVNTSRIYVDDASLTVEGGTEVTEAPPTSVPTSTPTSVAQVATPTPITSLPTSTVTIPPTATSPATGGPQPPTNEFPETIIHRVQPGDTVLRLANRYNSSISAIQQANGLNSTYLIFVGQQLIIPVPAAVATPVPTNPPVVIATPIPPGTGGPTPGTTRYTVLPGDTLTTIARRFNTTVAALAQLNGIVNPNSIFAGQVLNVPSDSSGGTGGPVIIPTTAPPTQPTVYIVQPGDTLYRLSLRFGVPISELISANDIFNVNRIFIGQRLIIP